MCKVFKIKTSSGLVTQTTDPEIVRCLLDNYDGELSIETKKQQICDEPQLDETGMAVCTDIPEPPEDSWIINAQPFTHENGKLAYAKALRNVLNIRLDIAKRYADNGFRTELNAKTIFKGLIGLLNTFHVQYTIDK